jgi:hypothetical protein
MGLSLYDPITNTTETFDNNQINKRFDLRQNVNLQ